MPLISSTLKIGNNAHNSHDNIIVEGEFVGNLIPNTTLTYDIGSTSKFWNNLYINNINTSITTRRILYSDNGVVTGSSTLVFEGNSSALKRMSLGTSAFYGKFCIYDTSPAPVQAGAPYYGNTSNYQLNIAGGNATGWSTGISFGYMADVGASIIQKNVGNYNQSDLLFLTKSSSASGVDPEVRMTLKSDGKLGIGVEEPFANLEVLASVGISNVNTGGELQFRKNGITATNTQDIGHIRFGTDSYTQSSVFSNATENWVAGSAHGTSVTISATPKGSTTETPIAYFDHSGSSIQSDWSVTGGVTATTYAGDGSALTGLAEGSNRQIQYNNNGDLGGSTMYYTSSGTYTLGTSGAYSRLFVYNAATYPLQNLGSMASYHLGLGGSTTTGRGVGIAFGNTNNVGASIVWEDIGTYIGDMIFYTKQSTSSGVAPIERLRITHDGKVCLSASTATYELNTKGDFGLIGSSTVAPSIKTFTDSQYPVGGSVLGKWTAGSEDFPDQGFFFFDSKSNWSATSRDARLHLYLTAIGSISPTRIALFDSQGLNLTGTVVADYFKGDGSQLTNLPPPVAQGSNANIQFNNNGVFAGAGYVNYYSATRGLTVGTAHNAQTSGLMVNETAKAPINATTDVTEYAYVSRYGNTTGASTGFAFYDTTRVTGNFLHVNYGNGSCATAFYILEANSLTNYLTLGLGKVTSYRPIDINTTGFNGQTVPLLNIRGSTLANYGASIHLSANTFPTAIIRTENLGSYGYGVLEFLLEEDQNTGTTPQKYLEMGAGKAEFLRTVDVNVYSDDPKETPANRDAYQLNLIGGTGGSAGVSFGSSNGIAWGIVSEQENSASRRGSLRFLYPTAATGTNFNAVSAFAIDHLGRVGFNDDYPVKDFCVTGDVLINKSGGAYTYWRNDTSYPTAGQPLATLNFGTDIGESQASLQVKALGNWTSSLKGTLLDWFATPSTSSTPVNIYRWYNKHFFYGLTEFDSTIIVNGGASFGTGFTVSGHDFTASNRVTTEDLIVNDDATVEGDLMMGYSSDINCNRYYYRGAGTTPTLEKKIEFTDANVVVYNSDFYVTSATNQRALFVDHSSAYGRVLIGTQYGSPYGARFLDGQDDTGLYVEGYGVGGHDTTADIDGGYQATQSSVMTVVNRNANNTQVVMDILAGAGVYDSSNIGENTSYTNWATENTTFIRFLNKNKVSWTGTSTTGTPKRIGRIRGNGSGGIVITNSFTGMHATVIELKPEYKIGMLMISTGEMWIKDAPETCLPKIAPTSTPKDKRVYGILAELESEFEGYIARGGLKENESQVQVYSLGEGAILVTNINGNIENGDYICSSEILGYGMLQDDDLLHNYTVAKCTENINWDDPNLETIEHNGQTYKVYLSACTYHCG